MDRWKINLYILWISQVISLTSFGFGLPFIPFFIQELGVTDPGQLKIFTGVLSLAPAITMAIMSPIWGILSDRFGQKLMIQRAMFAAVIIIAGMGFSASVWQLLILRFMQGLFTGTITASSAFVAVNTPNHKLSYALGFLSSSTFVGYSLGPFLGGRVAETFGYRVSFYVGAALMLIGFALVTIFLKGDKKPERRKTSVIKGSSKWKEIFAVGIMLLMAMLFLQRVIRTVFSPFIPLYVQELTHTTVGAASTTGSINGLIGFVTAIAAIMISRLGDKYDKMKMIRIMLSLALVDVLILNLTSGMTSFVVFYTLLFFIIGGIEPLITSQTAEMTSPDKRGTLFGIQGLVGSLGWMVSPVLGTYVSIQFGIKQIFWVLLTFICLNLCTAFIVKKYRNKQEVFNNDSL
ncbi:MFS transporter [Fusibacter bizertensis]|jgi:Sugar phosphate permease|uniref:MFS transporter n=1 Tax=Fusibacter bizertensis TaxID=1488331 RepID=A0ABT6NAN8_9FIRM|nr:MFS transporter [Fusibacter bizertensis]MDH8677477.1 MFS transporter [Fusibacter bizertensis]